MQKYDTEICTESNNNYTTPVSLEPTNGMICIHADGYQNSCL